MTIDLVLAGGIPEPNYGCGLTEISCHVSETAARITISIVGAMGNFIADMFVNAFGDSKIAAASWAVASGEFWFWAAIVAGFAATVMIWQVSAGALLRDHRRMVSSVIGGMISIPFSALCVTFMIRLTEAADTAAALATRSLQNETLSQALLHVVGLTTPSSTGGQELVASDWSATSLVVSLATHGTGQPMVNLGQVVLSGLIAGILALASGVLYLLMEIRNMGLLALAAMAPLALMFVGQPVLVTWAKRWGSLAVALILSKPIAAGVLTLLVKLTSAAPGVGPMLVFAGGVVVAAFAPVWTVALVNFAGDDLGNAFARRASMTQQLNKVQTVTSIGRGLGRK